MNILHIISSGDSYDAVHSALDLSRCLNKNNHKSIIASSLEGRILEGIDADLKYYEIFQSNNNIRDLFVAYNVLKKIINENKIDILHMHSASGIWPIFLLCRNTHIRLAVSCYDFFPKGILSQWLILADRIFVHNQAVGKQLIGNFGLSKDKVKFISPGIDIDNFKFQGVDERPKTDFTIGVIPSLLPEAGYEYFLKAMVKVVRIIPYINVSVLIHPLHQRKNIKEDLGFWTRRLGLANYVKFVDVSNFDMKFLTKFNLLICAPVAESSLTRAILEAQAYGVPVIASHVAGASQFISDGKTGILVSSKDHASLAGAIINVLKEFSFAREIGLAARREAEDKYHIAKNIGGFIDAYKELENKKKILIVNLGNANNVISTIPALSLLRKNIPDAEVDVLMLPALRCILQRCPDVNELIVYEGNYGKKFLSGFLKIVRLLIERKYDVVFDFSNSFMSQALCFLSLASQRYGYRNRFLHFLINNHIERPNSAVDLVKDKLFMLSLLGINSKGYKLELWPSREDADFVEEFFQDNWIGGERVVCIDISSKKAFFKDVKMVQCLAYLCNNLVKQHMRVIVIGSKESLKAEDELSKRTNPKSVAFINDISCNQLACFMKRAHLYISFHYDFIYIALTVKTPSLVVSLDKDISKFSHLKDVVVLTTKDFPLNKRMARRRKPGVIEEKDVVMQTIERLVVAR